MHIFLCETAVVYSSALLISMEHPLEAALGTEPQYRNMHFVCGNIVYTSRVHVVLFSLC